MMGKRAFHRLKTRGKRPETVKQAEMAVAGIVKILSIGRIGLGGQIPGGRS
jgi:hypothetical protein